MNTTESSQPSLRGMVVSRGTQQIQRARPATDRQDGGIDLGKSIAVGSRLKNRRFSRH
ncbi:hypothetical protein [Mesorhizobium sp.]|uniref:hypothetical protein n=1 Tax=Mesorhizobium sp. TaxID=1871066 RepID=UPI00257F40C2|nr:hypothetical protein [Mesorhizobium sp.]